MGDKIESKLIAKAAEVNTIPGFDGVVKVGAHPLSKKPPALYTWCFWHEIGIFQDFDVYTHTSIILGLNLCLLSTNFK